MTLEQFVLQWNNTWPRDYWWRQKYNIPFNSDRHREASQQDICFEYIEHQMANRAIEQFRLKEERDKLFKQGKWMRENMHQDQEDQLLSKVDWSTM